jgi:hypothetical protein
LQNVSSVVEMSRSFKNKVSPIHSKIKIASAFETESFDLGLDLGDCLFEGDPSFFPNGEVEPGNYRYNVTDGSVREALGNGIAGIP